MTEPVWLTGELVRAIHEHQLRLFGGPAGIRDEGALEPALGRARNRCAYEEADLASLAAAYAFGIARNHPFVDGNKRVGLLSALVFLELNGISLTQGSEELYALTMAVAAGQETKAGVVAALMRIAGVAPSGRDL